MSVAIQCQQRRLPIAERTIVRLYIIEDMALHDKGVLPAVVVKILETNSPTGDLAGERAEPTFEFLRAEYSVTFVVIHDIGLVRELRDQQIGEAVVIVILKRNAHPGEHFSIVRKRGAGI